ncbi:hypothetical protein AgCh_021976 [Apium graveolens]
MSFPVRDSIISFSPSLQMGSSTRDLIRFFKSRFSVFSIYADSDLVESSNWGFLILSSHLGSGQSSFVSSSPVRSLIETGFNIDERPDMRLYFGAKNLNMMAYQDRFKVWEFSGVRIVPVLSQPHDRWTGERGFVQDAFSRAKKIYNPHSTGAVLCGHRQVAEMHHGFQSTKLEFTQQELDDVPIPDDTYSQPFEIWYIEEVP